MHVVHFTPRTTHSQLDRVSDASSVTFVLALSVTTGLGVVTAVASVRHVGHMEQHPGSQEAAGLFAGEAAAAAERPRSTVGG